MSRHEEQEHREGCATNSICSSPGTSQRRSSEQVGSRLWPVRPLNTNIVEYRTPYRDAQRSRSRTQLTSSGTMSDLGDEDEEDSHSSSTSLGRLRSHLRTLRKARLLWDSGLSGEAYGSLDSGFLDLYADYEKAQDESSQLRDALHEPTHSERSPRRVLEEQEQQIDDLRHRLHDSIQKTGDLTQENKALIVAKNECMSYSDLMRRKNEKLQARLQRLERCDTPCDDGRQDSHSSSMSDVMGRTLQDQLKATERLSEMLLARWNECQSTASDVAHLQENNLREINNLHFDLNCLGQDRAEREKQAVELRTRLDESETPSLSLGSSGGDERNLLDELDQTLSPERADRIVPSSAPVYQHPALSSLETVDTLHRSRSRSRSRSPQRPPTDISELRSVVSPQRYVSLLGLDQTASPEQITGITVEDYGAGSDEVASGPKTSNTMSPTMSQTGALTPRSPSVTSPRSRSLIKESSDDAISRSFPERSQLGSCRTSTISKMRPNLDSRQEGSSSPEEHTTSWGPGSLPRRDSSRVTKSVSADAARPVIDQKIRALQLGSGAGLALGSPEASSRNNQADDSSSAITSKSTTPIPNQEVAILESLQKPTDVQQSDSQNRSMVSESLSEQMVKAPHRNTPDMMPLSPQSDLTRQEQPKCSNDNNIDDDINDADNGDDDDDESKGQPGSVFESSGTEQSTNKDNEQGDTSPKASEVPPQALQSSSTRSASLQPGHAADELPEPRQEFSNFQLEPRAPYSENVVITSTVKIRSIAHHAVVRPSVSNTDGLRSTSTSQLRSSDEHAPEASTLNLKRHGLSPDRSSSSTSTAVEARSSIGFSESSTSLAGTTSVTTVSPEVKAGAVSNILSPEGGRRRLLPATTIFERRAGRKPGARTRTPQLAQHGAVRPESDIPTGSSSRPKSGLMTPPLSEMRSTRGDFFPGLAVTNPFNIGSAGSISSSSPLLPPSSPPTSIPSLNPTPSIRSVPLPSSGFSTPPSPSLSRTRSTKSSQASSSAYSKQKRTSRPLFFAIKIEPRPESMRLKKVFNDQKLSIENGLVSRLLLHCLEDSDKAEAERASPLHRYANRDVDTWRNDCSAGEGLSRTRTREAKASKYFDAYVSIYAEDEAILDDDESSSGTDSVGTSDNCTCSCHRTNGNYPDPGQIRLQEFYRTSKGKAPRRRRFSTAQPISVVGREESDDLVQLANDRVGSSPGYKDDNSGSLVFEERRQQPPGIDNYSGSLRINAAAPTYASTLADASFSPRIPPRLEHTPRDSSPSPQPRGDSDHRPCQHGWNPHCPESVIFAFLTRSVASALASLAVVLSSLTRSLSGIPPRSGRPNARTASSPLHPIQSPLPQSQPHRHQNQPTTSIPHHIPTCSSRPTLILLCHLLHLAILLTSFLFTYQIYHARQAWYTANTSHARAIVHAWRDEHWHFDPPAALARHFQRAIEPSSLDANDILFLV